MSINNDNIIDNIILQKKHFLMQIMLNGNEVKKRTEAEAYDDKLTMRRLNEIETIWNYTFINLIREGLQYDYIKHPTDEKKDFVRLTIDNVQYDCPVKSLKKILGTDYNNVINEEHIVKNDVEDINIERTTNINDENTENQKNTKDIDRSKPKTESTKSEVVIDFNPTPITDKEELQNKANYEMYKDKSTFVYDVYELEILPPGGKEGSIVKAIIAPLKMAENDVHPDVMALLINSKGQVETYCSQKTAALKIAFDGNDFLIRGSFADGDFKSHIILTGNTLAMGFNLNIKKQINYRCDNKSLVNYGHVCFEKNGYIYHVIPTSVQNDCNGVAHCFICVENTDNIYSDTYFRETQSTNIDSSLFFCRDGKTNNVLVYWKDDVLCADVVNS